MAREAGRWCVRVARHSAGNPRFFGALSHEGDEVAVERGMIAL